MGGVFPLGLDSSDGQRARVPSMAVSAGVWAPPMGMGVFLLWGRDWWPLRWKRLLGCGPPSDDCRAGGVPPSVEWGED